MQVTVGNWQEACAIYCFVSVSVFPNGPLQVGWELTAILRFWKTPEYYLILGPKDLSCRYSYFRS